MRDVTVYEIAEKHRMCAGDVIEWFSGGRLDVRPLSGCDGPWVEKTCVRFAAPVETWARTDGTEIHVAVNPEASKLLRGYIAEQLVRENDGLRASVASLRTSVASLDRLLERSRATQKEYLDAARYYTDGPLWRRVWRALRGMRYA